MDIEEMIVELSEEYLRAVLGDMRQMDQALDQNIKDLQSLNEYFQTALASPHEPGVATNLTNRSIFLLAATTFIIVLILILSCRFRRQRMQAQPHKTE